MHNQRKQNHQDEIGKLSSPRQHVIFQMFFEKTNMLGMQDEEEKGFHPYKFRNMIPEDFFDLENMKETECQKFKTWYAEKQKQIYNFEQELFKYCSNNVDILRKCLLKINSIVKNATEMEFLVILLKNFAKEDSLPITPITQKRTTNHKAMQQCYS